MVDLLQRNFYAQHYMTCRRDLQEKFLFIALDDMWVEPPKESFVRLQNNVFPPVLICFLPLRAPQNKSELPFKKKRENRPGPPPLGSHWVWWYVYIYFFSLLEYSVSSVFHLQNV